MPHKLIGIAVLLGLGGFIWFAFRQGLSVKPDPNNRNFSPSHSGSYGDNNHGADGGHGGSF